MVLDKLSTDVTVIEAVQCLGYTATLNLFKLAALTFIKSNTPKEDSYFGQQQESLRQLTQFREEIAEAQHYEASDEIAQALITALDALHQSLTEKYSSPLEK